MILIILAFYKMMIKKICYDISLMKWTYVIRKQKFKNFSIINDGYGWISHRYVFWILNRVFRKLFSNVFNNIHPFCDIQKIRNYKMKV